DHIDVQVQGEAAPAQIAGALEQLNEEAELPDVIVLVRGGGSAEDLAAFSSETVVRAVAASRVPTLAAVGHETDLSLAELAADRRASTPSNAAELLVPDRRHVLAELRAGRGRLEQRAEYHLRTGRGRLEQQSAALGDRLDQIFQAATDRLAGRGQLLQALNPEAVLRRGYAIVRRDSRPLRSTRRLAAGAIVDVQLVDGRFRAAVSDSQPEKA
ncbi:MAG TPA: exodeoxyribonuclease VII large subunit, partial [Candidatus Saccharimonadales bacterium]|nr:exodeoxyribonuclease VII large subunit [Candidatus Saccharimonadales bacterium]